MLQPEKNEDGEGVVAEMLPRSRTVLELLVKKPDVMSSTELGVAHGRPKLTNLLLHVTIQRSLRAINVLMSLDAMMDDLITAALWQYAKEGQRPIIASGRFI
ncbi:putative protein-like [Abeliophyllum distichum]|uniref:DUF7054 domain-containing protein n=1 Tax=Abeliophyllum distichum TaxID=126358 RepID=A0ABD1VXM8_9LAMI